MSGRPEPFGEHPTETALADLVTGALDDVRSSAMVGHLAECLACRMLFARLSRSAGTATVPPDLGEDGAAVVPDAVRTAVANADRPAAGPSAGELWRARRPGEEVSLVWLREHGAAGIVAVPVSLDVDLADEHTLIVPATESPLGTPLALHVAAERTVQLETLLDRLGVLDVAPAVEATLAAAPTEGRSPLDQRAEFRQLLASSIAADTAPGDDDAWWLLDTRSDTAALLVALHDALRESHPHARIAPRPPTTAGSGHLNAVALVAEVDAFVLVATRDVSLPAAALLEGAREALHADQLLNAVCVVEPVAPYLCDVIDRRDVVAAIETPSGSLRPPRQSRPSAAVGDALTKYLDVAISPFGRLARTAVESEPVDAHLLAVDVAAEAVRSVKEAARSFKVEGKRPGYERVVRHQATITRLVEAALSNPDVDVAAILEDDE